MSSYPWLEANRVKELAGQGARFVGVGLVNTLGTLTLYQLLLFLMPYTPAYALAWFTGLVFVNVAYPRFVYGKRQVTGRETVLNSVYYLLSFAASWMLLYVITSIAGVPARLSVFCVLAVMVPLNFLVTRYIYRPGETGPSYRKPRTVVGNKLILRDATPADAAFTLELRTDAVKSRFLSSTSADLQKQVAWLETYATDDSQVYFVIEDKAGNRVGTVRLYDRQGSSFCWGSWIIKEGCPGTYAIESALMVYQFARSLGFDRAHFNVRKQNESVWRFHERFGAVRTGESGEDYTYSISAAAIRASLEKYARYLPNRIGIIY